jgi:hypothetical protein
MWHRFRTGAFEFFASMKNMLFLNKRVRKNESASRLVRSGSWLCGPFVHLDQDGFIFFIVEQLR